MAQYRKHANRPTYVGVSLALVLLFVCLMQGCNSGRTLVDGYRLLYMDGGQAAIATPSNEVITRGAVTQLAVRGHTITGYTTKQNMDPDADPVEGYFVLDTQSGAFQEGLSENAWHKEMEKVDWRDPAMKSPDVQQ